MVNLKELISIKKKTFCRIANFHFLLSALFARFFSKLDTSLFHLSTPCRLVLLPVPVTVSLDVELCMIVNVKN